MNSFKTWDENEGLQEGVSLGEVPQEGPCSPRFVVESSLSQPAQEVASSPFLLAQAVLARLESILPRIGVAQGISQGTQALLVWVQSLPQ